MRLIEKEMVAALKDKRDWHKDNTSVTWQVNVAEVRLYRHLVATYTPSINTLYLRDAGWQTVTTKSRLNALLDAFAPGQGIFQRDFAWYVTSNPDDDNAVTPWTGAASFMMAG